MGKMHNITYSRKYKKNKGYQKQNSIDRVSKKRLYSQQDGKTISYSLDSSETLGKTRKSNITFNESDFITSTQVKKSNTAPHIRSKTFFQTLNNGIGASPALKPVGTNIKKTTPLQTASYNNASKECSFYVDSPASHSDSSEENLGRGKNSRQLKGCCSQSTRMAKATLKTEEKAYTSVKKEAKCIGLLPRNHSGKLNSDKTCSKSSGVKRSTFLKSDNSFSKISQETNASSGIPCGQKSDHDLYDYNISKEASLKQFEDLFLNDIPPSIPTPLNKEEMKSTPVNDQYSSDEDIVFSSQRSFASIDPDITLLRSKSVTSDKASDNAQSKDVDPDSDCSFAKLCEEFLHFTDKGSMKEDFVETSKELGYDDESILNNMHPSITASHKKNIPPITSDNVKCMEVSNGCTKPLPMIDYEFPVTFTQDHQVKTSKINNNFPHPLEENSELENKIQFISKEITNFLREKIKTFSDTDNVLCIIKVKNSSHECIFKNKIKFKDISGSITKQEYPIRINKVNNKTEDTDEINIKDGKCKIEIIDEQHCENLVNEECLPIRKSKKKKAKLNEIDEDKVDGSLIAENLVDEGFMPIRKSKNKKRNDTANFKINNQTDEKCKIKVIDEQYCENLVNEGCMPNKIPNCKNEASETINKFLSNLMDSSSQEAHVIFNKKDKPANKRGKTCQPAEELKNKRQKLNNQINIACSSYPNKNELKVLEKTFSHKKQTRSSEIVPVEKLKHSTSIPEIRTNSHKLKAMGTIADLHPEIVRGKPIRSRSLGNDIINIACSSYPNKNELKVPEKTFSHKKKTRSSEIVPVEKLKHSTSKPEVRTHSHQLKAMGTIADLHPEIVRGKPIRSSSLGNPPKQQAKPSKNISKPNKKQARSQISSDDDTDYTGKWWLKELLDLEL